MTKAELTAALQVGCAEVVAFFEQLEPRVLMVDATPSEWPGGRPWSAKDHLAHLVQREEDFIPIAKRLIAGDPAPLRLEHRGSTNEARSNFVNRENQRAIEDRTAQKTDELVAELVRLRSELVTLVQSMPQAIISREVEVAPTRTVPGHSLLLSVDRHAKAHLQFLGAALTG